MRSARLSTSPSLRGDAGGLLVARVRRCCDARVRGPERVARITAPGLRSGGGPSSTGSAAGSNAELTPIPAVARAGAPAWPGARPRRAAAARLERPLPLARPRWTCASASCGEARPPLRVLLHPDAVRRRLPVRPYAVRSRVGRSRPQPCGARSCTSGHGNRDSRPASHRGCRRCWPERPQRASLALLRDMLRPHWPDTAADLSVHAVVVRGEMMAIHRPQPRDSGPVPARRCLRSRGRERGCPIRDSRRPNRPVLLDAHGRGLARRGPQAGARDAAHGRADRRRLRPTGDSSTTSCHVISSARRRSSLPVASPSASSHTLAAGQGGVLRAARPRPAGGVRHASDVMAAQITPNL